MSLTEEQFASLPIVLSKDPSSTKLPCLSTSTNTQQQQGTQTDDNKTNSPSESVSEAAEKLRLHALPFEIDASSEAQVSAYFKVTPHGDGMLFWLMCHEFEVCVFCFV
jgi:hypothetical protein